MFLYRHRIYNKISVNMHTILEAHRYPISCRCLAVGKPDRGKVL